MMNANEDINEPIDGGNEQQPSDLGSVSASASWRDDDDQVHLAQREEFLSHRRRCCLFVSVFPFLISAVALCTMLAFNSSSETATTSTMQSSSVSMRGSPSSKGTGPHIETSYLQDDTGTGILSNETLFVDSSSTTSSTTYGIASTTTDLPVEEDVLDLIATTTAAAAATTRITTVQPEATTTVSVIATTQTEPTIAVTSEPPVTTTNVVTTTPVAETTAAVEIITSTRPETTTAAPQILTCEEATAHDECIKHSVDCVWFTPVNWSELCFTKPDFPLNKCKEVRLMDDCVESAVGCIWIVEKAKQMRVADAKEKKKPAKDKGGDFDVCRFARDKKLRWKNQKGW